MSDIIVEFIQQGRFVKVSAVDARTGFETSIVGDPSVGEAELKRLAVQKLNFVMEKRRKEADRDGKGPGRGLII